MYLFQRADSDASFGMPVVPDSSLFDDPIRVGPRVGGWDDRVAEPPGLRL